MGISVCLASGKDGAGKSTIIANLGISLSSIGINTLILDGDIKGASLGLILGADPNAPSLHDVLSGKTNWEEAMIETHGTNVIVGGIKIEQVIEASLDKFPELLAEVLDKFDIILVDTPGGLGNDALTVINACQSLILVITPDIDSVTNGLKILAVARKVNAPVLGAIINRSGGEYDIPADKISDLLRVSIIAELTNDEKVKKSLNDAVPVVVEYPKSEFSNQIGLLANTLLGKE